MSFAGSSMLFMPPEPPFELRGDSTVVLGRSRSCELRLANGEASRRHAEICATEDGFLLRDLASTNGTFVNGERITERALQPGDRIQIGGNALTFCQVGSGLGSALQGGEDKTILVERPVLGEAFQGDLAEIPPYAILQILELGRKTGLLKLDSDRGAGSLWLHEGSPVHAVTKNQVGFDAALSLVHAAQGRFDFEPQAESPEMTINASVTELLLEASRILDEEGEPTG